VRFPDRQMRGGLRRPADARVGALRRRAVAALAVGVFMGAMVLTVPAGGAAAELTSCGFAGAGSGTYATTLCWLDLAGYSAASATSPGGQAMTLSLPGGYTISFNLHVTGGSVRPNAFPTYSGAYLGNSGNYTGVRGRPALYQTQHGTTTTATLDHIEVSDASGDAVTGYALVGADAEDTGSNEWIEWSSDSSLSLISDLGNACGSGTALRGLDTSSVTCTGTSYAKKTGTAILAAKNPSIFSQTMVGQGLEGVAFGVLISKVALTVAVAGRVDPSDAFAVDVSTSSGGSLATASTGTASSATTGELTVLTSDTGEEFTLSSRQVSGVSSNYTTSWSCTRNGAGDPALPSGDAGGSASVNLEVGDFVACTITLTPKPASIVLTKQAQRPVDVNQDGLHDAGDTIDYTFTVTNGGELPLSDVRVDDSLLGPISCPPVTLTSGESVACSTGTYTVTQNDDAKGSVVNTATTSGLPPGSTVRVTSPQASTTTAVATPDSRVSLVKVANASAGDTSAPKLGETIAYAYLVTNTGNVNLASVAVSDPTIGPVTCPSPAAPGLAPADSLTCTAERPHTVTSADVAAGAVSDTATATGTDPAGRTSPPSDASTALVETAPAAPRVALTKRATVSPSDHQDGARPGDTIAYTFKVTNIGNVDLASVAVSDPSLGTVTCPAPAAPGLAPGDSITCTAETTHKVDEPDIAAGTVTDTATATGTDAAGVTSPSSEPSTTRVPTVADRRVSIVKHAAVSPAADEGGARLGDTIDYTYAVTNEGDINLVVAIVDDPSAGAVICPTPGAPGLAPGQTVTCTAERPQTVDPVDVAAGAVIDTATATGKDAAGVTSAPSASSTARVPVVSDPRVSIVKHDVVSPPSDEQTAKLYDEIAYTYDVTNDGDVPLTKVTVDDPSVGSVTCPRPAAPGLEPHATITCTGDRIVTVDQGDVDAGVVEDHATATGTDAAGQTSPQSAPSVVRTRIVATDPEVAVVARPTVADDLPVAGPGSTIDYTYTVTNTGNIGLREVAVEDESVGAVVCPKPPRTGLAHGRSIQCAAGKGVPVTAAQVAAGKAVDHVTATGIGVRSSESMHPASDTVTTPVASRPVSRGNGKAKTPVASRPISPSPGVRAIGTDLGRWSSGGRVSRPFATTVTRSARRSGASVTIPALHVDAPLAPTGATGRPGAASLDIPDRIDEVVWWDGTFTDGDIRLKSGAPAPGDPGVAIIAGHVASATLGPGAFYHLGTLRRGATITVVGPSGRRTRWRVSAPPVTVPKGALPRALFATSGRPRLALVTCGGPFDSATGHYLDNVIVWAKPVLPTTPAG
jgi:uncharacterized repeat protein (TIGR01451 family)